MANCTINQRNFASSPADMMHGLANLIYDATDWVQNKTDDLLSKLEGTNVDSHQKFVENNNKYMKRLMKINLNQRNHILDEIGKNAHMNGLSDSYTPGILHPTYVEDNNYLDFAQKVQSEEMRGNITTRMNNFQGYGEVANLYPDELGAFSSGTDVSKIYSFGSNSAGGYASTSESSFNIWNVGCETNSILYKTKKLYNERKINSIVARFGTGADMVSPIKYNGQIATQYGESRGRNLLTKEAEKGFGGGYNINGYKNPYCRVWTHHYKYDTIYKTMRPFSSIDTKDGRGGYNGTASLKDIHNWKNFQKHKLGERKEWGWKTDNDGYDKSVMANGMINYAPMYSSQEDKKIHTKQCMFSIENLAWKDFDPYNFENCLSWEQRGPNGGRIMWFPPYGLSFNETTQARWQGHSFIGRGEEVYTYQDTIRSGTLTFLMVVDHPSIIDYVFGQHNKKNGISDNDVNRYFAGCDRETLEDAAQPTPLTDEYSAYINYGDVELHNDLKLPETPQPKTPSASVDKITVSCYFPNNYSGVYDNNTFQDDDNKISSMKYLLMGYAGGIKHSGDVKDQKWELMDNSTLNSQKTVGDKENGISCHGYAMGNGIVVPDSDEYLIIQQQPRFTNNNKTMSGVEDAGWFYRVDYNPKFTWPTGDEKYKNTIDQVTSSSDKKRKIEQGYDYNANPGENKNESEKKVSFLQFCCGVMQTQKKQEDLLRFLKLSYPQYLEEKEESVYKTFIDLIEKIGKNEKKIKSVTAIGYSSKRQSGNSIGDKRNEYLAKQRAEMLKQLFNSSGIAKNNVEIQILDPQSSQGEMNENVSGQNETQNRRADLVIEFETEQTQTIAEVDNSAKQAKLDKYNEINKYIGYNRTERTEIIGGKEYYLYEETASDGTPSNRLWYNVEDWIGRKEEKDKIVNEYVKLENILNDASSSEEDIEYAAEKLDELDFGNPQGWRLFDEEIIKSGHYSGAKIKERNDEKNNLRYDQEYYFFKKLEANDNITYKKLVDKLQYFDPAFHSMTPEGFNGRLTFLNQCMRQGDTLVSVESNRQQASARNLAFGRPPFCVLRIGDFYNQTIIIENLSINYDFNGGINWDLNSEGIGVQPLLAQVQLSIKFIGGGDMSGPIRRLQNAMSFNYYANTSLYDNRTDRYNYEYDPKTGQNGAIIPESSWIYDAHTKGVISYNKNETNLVEKQILQKVKDIGKGLEVNPMYEKGQIKSIHGTTYGKDKNVSKGKWSLNNDDYLK